MSEFEPQPMSLRASNYEYRVGLGSVDGPDSIGWNGWYRCSKWRDVERLVDIWYDTRDNAAVRVDVNYTGEQP